MAISKYTSNVLFGLGYLYIQLYKPGKAEKFLLCLAALAPSNKQAQVLLYVSQVMQGKKLNATEFNFARLNAPPAIVQMLAKRTHISKKVNK